MLSALIIVLCVLCSITRVSEVFPVYSSGDGLDCPGISANEKLINYFRLQETKPAQIVNNLDPGAWKSRRSIINVGKHKIEWVLKVTEGTSKTTLKIDDHRISLEGIQSTNLADGEDRIVFEQVDRWEQVKLYDLGNRKLIGITLCPQSCTGLSCGVAAQLLYDLKTRKATFFGTFRSDDEVRLFRLTNDEEFYYLSKNFEGDYHGKEFSITYNAYRLTADGTFDLQKDDSGKAYYLKHTMFPVDIEPYTLRKLSGEKPDQLEQNWIGKID
jgi:hypothetical protein